jgi:tetratricopeptide (TPR) repeat protein
MSQPTDRHRTKPDARDDSITRARRDDAARADAAAPKPARRGLKRGELPLVALLAACLGASVCAARWMDSRRSPRAEVAQVSEELYVTPRAARRMSLGFNGLAADWYWLRTLQYVGRKVTAHEGPIQLDDLSGLELKILAPLLENATTLDPQFVAAYEYGAVVLPAVDADAAIKLVNKGIEANPKAWRLRTYLGYIYWQRGRYREAGEAYAAAARVEGAPAWPAAMSAQMSTKGGSRETARAIYEMMLRTTDDAQMKQTALDRLAQLQSLDEMDALRRLLAAHRERNGGRCPSGWRELAPALRAARFAQDASGAPLDPGDAPYHLISDKCDVELGAQSRVLRNY